MKRLLVTGAGGFLGWHVCRLAQPAWEVFGTCHTGKVDSAGVNPLYLDLADQNRLTDMFFSIGPDAVIHTAAVSDPNVCEENPEAVRSINIDTPACLARLCAQRQIPYVFTSSDLVFDGRQAPYREIDPIAPINVYGRQKALAEQAILSAHPAALICRLPLMFGWSGSKNKAFDHRIMQALVEGSTVRLFIDEFRTPVDAESAAQGIFYLLERAHGILHLGGRERVSRFEMGLRFARQMDISHPSILEGRQAEMTMRAPRAADISLISASAYRLGYDPRPLDEAIKEAVRRFVP